MVQTVVDMHITIKTFDLGPGGQGPHVYMARGYLPSGQQLIETPGCHTDDPGYAAGLIEAWLAKHRPRWTHERVE